MLASVLVPLATGFEELEAVTMIDILRRAGSEVVITSCTPELLVTGSHDISLNADCLISSCTDSTWDMVALPGGLPGADNLYACQSLQGILQQQQSSQKWIAAICAAPAVVLAQQGFLGGKQATCYPSFEEKNVEDQQPCWQPDKDVVIDQAAKIITSRGPGTAHLFALTLVSLLQSKHEAKQLADVMLFPFPTD